MFIINFENLVHNTPSVMNALVKFLGLKSGFGPTAALPHDNEASITTTIDCKTRDQLYATYAPHVQSLHEYMANAPAAGKPASEPEFLPFTEELQFCT